MGALKTHPKVYWIWNHRRWCLENIPSGPAPAGEEDANGWKQAAWQKDLFVVEQMLNKDPRNCGSLLSISLSSHLMAIQSPRLGLSEIYPFSDPQTTTTKDGTSLHQSKNRL